MSLPGPCGFEIIKGTGYVLTAKSSCQLFLLLRCTRGLLREGLAGRAPARRGGGGGNVHDFLGYVFTGDD
ncbi:hypothetical protein KIF59_02405 [Enterobacter cloacae subsp. cloacae]|nr:hypothetical protein [Enterobacter cloacae subsp. cloacae]